MAMVHAWIRDLRRYPPARNEVDPVSRLAKDQSLSPGLGSLFAMKAKTASRTKTDAPSPQRKLPPLTHPPPHKNTLPRTQTSYKLIPQLKHTVSAYTVHGYLGAV